VRLGQKEKRSQSKKNSKIQWSAKKRRKRTVMNPIWGRMKKRSPSSGQNGQVHWWLLVHSGPQALALCWLTSDGLVFSGILGPRTSASIKLNSLLGFKSSLLLYLWVPTRRESQFSNLKAKSLQRQAFHFWKLLLAAADARFGIEGEFFLRNFFCL
jgi:hypothetical protein